MPEFLKFRARDSILDLNKFHWVFEIVKNWADGIESTIWHIFKDIFKLKSDLMLISKFLVRKNHIQIDFLLSLGQIFFRPYFFYLIDLILTLSVLSTLKIYLILNKIG